MFIPLTNLGRDVASDGTFAHTDDDPRAHTMSPDEVLAVAEAGRQLGCKEALFTLGDRPEARFPSQGGAAALRPRDTESYLAAMCATGLEKTGSCPTPTLASSAAASSRSCARSRPARG